MSAVEKAVRQEFQQRSKTLVDVDGAPLTAAEDSHYDAASRSLPQFRSWNPSLQPADVESLYEQFPIMARSRDLVRNNGLASGAVRTITDNVVGYAGMRLTARPDYELLGRDEKWAEDWSRDVERKYRSWAESVESDAAMLLTHASMTTLAFQSAVQDGDVVALAKWLPKRVGAKWATCAQMIDPERLSNPFGGLNTQFMRNGIELDENGMPTAYNVRKMAPGAMFGYIGWTGAWERIPARTSWGRRNVLHLFEQRRPGQNRGLPDFTPVMSAFKMLGKYTETELQASIANGLIAAFIKSDMSPQSTAETLGGTAKTIQTQNGVNITGDQRGWNANQNRWDARLVGGSIIQLPPGAELQSFMPGRPATAFGGFVQASLRFIAAGLNMPYELLAKDFSQTNYSSARAVLLEAWRFFRARRYWLAAYWCQPWYELWIEEAVNIGEVEAPDFYENRYAYCKARWIGAGRGWVDPVKEAQAAALRIAGGFSTLEAECAEQGEDWEEVVKQRKREKLFIEEQGLEDADYAQIGGKGGQPQQTDPADDGDGDGGEPETDKGGKPITDPQKKEVDPA